MKSIEDLNNELAESFMKYCDNQTFRLFQTEKAAGKIENSDKLCTEKSIPEPKIVYGEGDSYAKLMLIGEAPGSEEDRLGRPFVGKAGKNLDEFLKVLNLRRENIYITNLVKIRPVQLSEKTGRPVNRPPSKIEIEFFKPFLLEEMDIIKPEWVITLGNYPLKALLGKDSTIGLLHGKKTERDDYTLFPLYHPASIIYNRALKDIYYDDLIRLRDDIGV